MNLLEALPLTETKLKVLLEIYAKGEDYLRSIERGTKLNPSLLFRVLRNLQEAGVISRTERGRESFYLLTEAGKNFFVGLLEEYHLEKAAERTREIRIILKLIFSNKELLAKVRKIYLFGSYITGGFTKESDIDILFISKEKDEIIRWCREASSATGKEINPLVYSPEKFKSELGKKEPMLTSIVKNIKNRVIAK